MAQRTEEIQDIRSQQGWLFHGGEMTTLCHHRPLPDVGIDLLRNRARRAADFLRERSIPGRDIHYPAIGDRPRAMQAIVIRPEGGADRAREPVKRYIGEQVVAGHHSLEITRMVGPYMELLRDPGCEASR